MLEDPFVQAAPALLSQAGPLAEASALWPALAAAAGATGAGIALLALQLRQSLSVEGRGGPPAPPADPRTKLAQMLGLTPAIRLRASIPPRRAPHGDPGGPARFSLAPGPSLHPWNEAAAQSLRDLLDPPGSEDPAPRRAHDPVHAGTIAAAFPDDAEALSEALTALERRGDAFSMLLRAADGAVWSAHGAPEGGIAWVSLHPADPTTLALRAEAEAAAETRGALDRAEETLDAAPILAWRRDPEGTLTWANARYRAFTGSPPGGPLRELDCGAASIPEGAEDAPRADTPGSGRRALYQAGTGQRRWHEISSTTLPDGGVLGFAVDAGPAVMAESALRRFVETLTETFAHLRIGLAIFDHSRRLGLFNPAFAEMMRLDPSALAARPRLEDVLARLRENRMMPDRSDYAAWRDELMQLFDQPDAADYAELWHLPGDVTIRVIARPHPQGSLAFLFEDVSETAMLERRFATETEIRRAVIDRLEEGVAAFDPNGAARFANPAFARIWGFRPGGSNAPQGLSAVIKRCKPLTTPPAEPLAGMPKAAGRDIWDRLAAFAAEGARRTAWSERVEMIDGRVLRARIATLPDGAILTAFLDVTANERAASALKERNSALEAAAEMRGALFEQTSRKLRAPLNAIAGQAERLRAIGDDAVTGRATTILQRTHQLQEAMNAMFDLANAQEGVLELHRDEVDLSQVFEDVARRVGPVAAERGVKLATEVDADTGTILVDGARLRQILVNLLSDAVQRAPRGRVVRSGARGGPETPEGDATIQFWAIEPPGSDGARRGLAHALARRLAELHGGTLAVQQGPGGPAGPTEVICTLPAPRLQERAPEAAAPDAEIHVAPGFSEPAAPPPRAAERKG